jgi:hypothetical protein
MACIKIWFPKISYTTSTWVHDDEWYGLSTQQQTALIHKYVKENYPKQMRESQVQMSRTKPNFRWSEI